MTSSTRVDSEPGPTAPGRRFRVRVIGVMAVTALGWFRAFYRFACERAGCVAVAAQVGRRDVAFAQVADVKPVLSDRLVVAAPVKGSRSLSCLQSAAVRSQSTFGSWRDLLVTLLVTCTILFVFSHTAADPDLWAHVRFGLDLWDAKQVVRQDTYSYTSGDAAWINHEWLAEALFAGVYRTSGTAGLIGLKVALTLGILGGAYAHLRSRGLSVPRGSITLLAVSLLLSPGLVSIRPHIFTYLCYVVLLACLSSAEAGRVGSLWACRRSLSPGPTCMVASCRVWGSCVSGRRSALAGRAYIAAA
jgi:hypothetical protein